MYTINMHGYICYSSCYCAVYTLYEVNSNSNRCLFSELPSASIRVRHTGAAAAAHPLEFEVSRFRRSQFARCFLPAQWKDLPYTVFVTGTLDGFKRAVNRLLLPWVMFFSILWHRCVWGCESNFYAILFFSLGLTVPFVLIMLLIIIVSNV